MPSLVITPKQLEALCVALSLTSTGLAAFQRKETWLIAILASCLNGYLYWSKAIFGHFLLDMYYILTSLIGWIYWTKKPKQPRTLKISTLSFIMLGIGVGAFIISPILQHVKSNSPFWDAVSTLSALVAQLLLSQQVLQNWFFWIIHDLSHLIVCYHVGLPLQCIKIFIYVVMGLYGWFYWKKNTSIASA